MGTQGTLENTKDEDAKMTYRGENAERKIPQRQYRKWALDTQSRLLHHYQRLGGGAEFIVNA